MLDENTRLFARNGELVRECQALRNELRQANQQLLEQAAIKTALQHELQKLTTHCGELANKLSALYQRTPAILSEAAQKRANLERLLVLAGMDNGNALWLTVLSYLDEHERTELQAALAPNLSNDLRQFNAGRAACAMDLAFALRDLRIEADKKAKELSRK